MADTVPFAASIARETLEWARRLHECSRTVVASAFRALFSVNHTMNNWRDERKAGAEAGCRPFSGNKNADWKCKVLARAVLMGAAPRSALPLLRGRITTGHHLGGGSSLPVVSEEPETQRVAPPFPRAFLFGSAFTVASHHGEHCSSADSDARDAEASCRGTLGGALWSTKRSFSSFHGFRRSERIKQVGCYLGWERDPSQHLGQLTHTSGRRQINRQLAHKQRRL